MKYSLTTSWSLIEGAATGKTEAREEFARRYAPVMRSYLIARWRTSPLYREIDDAIQTAFLECFKQGGVLGKAEQNRSGGFRAYLFGLVRNVALKFEEKKNRRSRASGPAGKEIEELPESRETLSVVFDRAWAISVAKEAAALQAERSRSRGENAVRRIEILRLKFQEGMSIREMGSLWKVDCALLYREYAAARKEFRKALREVLTADHSGTPEEIERVFSELKAVLD